MTQISLLSGLASDANADWRTQYPVNLVPVPKDTGISKGNLRMAPGLTQFATGPGTDRGSITWNGVNCRVMGGSLVSVSSGGAVTVIGTIAGATPVSMDYGPDHLCIVGGGNAYLYNGATLTQITDVDIGTPIDVLWVDGYFMFTDGSFLYVTDLADPFSIDPLKYASSEIDPDSIIGLLKYRNEVYALNQNTTEVFDNLGGTGFAFQRLPGGLIPKGCIGTKAKALFGDSFAWIGNARNEPCSVYVASGGSALKIATREIETRLEAYTDAQLATAIMEARADKAHQHLMIHLPSETMVYDAAASVVAGEPIWFFLSTGAAGLNAYRARNFTWCYGKWLVGDTQDGRIGYVNEAVASQYTVAQGWQFDTMFLYNEGKGAIFWSLELVGTMGRATGDPLVYHSYTLDGLSWSVERSVRMGSSGQTQQRVVFRRVGRMENFRGDRFRGVASGPFSWARLEAELESLSA